MYKHLENKGLNSREIISLSNIDAKVKREQIELARHFNKPHAHHHCTKNLHKFTRCKYGAKKCKPEGN